MAKGLTISPSSLDAYYQCPARYRYQKGWSKVKLDTDLQDGIDAHALMAGLDYHAVNPSNRALNFAAKLKELLVEQGYTLVTGWSEHKLTWTYGPLRARGIVDGLAWTKEHELVVIDYKTGTWPWYEFAPGCSPKALGSFQSVVYTLPPDQFEKSPEIPYWPRELHYLTVSERGASAVYSYHRSEADTENFVEAVAVVEAAKRFPKHRGSHCRYCPFLTKCFDREKPGEYEINKRNEAWEDL
jgi:RecB family exonuclease